MSSLFFWIIYFTLDDVYKVKAVFINKGGWQFAKDKGKGSMSVILVKFNLQIRVCNKLYLKLRFRFLIYFITIKFIMIEFSEFQLKKLLFSRPVLTVIII